jgi:hypothetical protein
METVNWLTQISLVITVITLLITLEMHIGILLRYKEEKVPNVVHVGKEKRNAPGAANLSTVVQ